MGRSPWPLVSDLEAPCHLPLIELGMAMRSWSVIPVVVGALAGAIVVATGLSKFLSLIGEDPRWAAILLLILSATTWAAYRRTFSGPASLETATRRHEVAERL